MFFKKNHDLSIIKDLPITQRLNTYIHHPTKWGYIKSLHMIKQEHYIIHPRHSGEINIGHYMTLIIQEIHDIETKYLRQDLVINN